MRIAVTLLLLLFSTCGFAAEAPRIVHFDRNGYQAHHQNWSVAQSSDGILFFGNTAGLLEYDGASWTLHNMPNSQTVRAVAAGDDGRIYAGGYGEFGYWERKKGGHLQYVSLSARLPAGSIGKEEIWHILVTRRGVFFQSFGAVFLFDGLQVRPIPIPGNVMFVKEVDGNILIPAIEGRLYEWTLEESWRPLPGSEVFRGQIITAILSDPGGLLVGTQGKGIFRFNGHTFLPWDHPVNPLLGANQLNKAIRLRDGRLAFGTILNGLYLTNPSGQVIHHFNQENGLQNNTVLALHEDAGRNLWIGLDKGIDLIAFSDPLQYLEDRQGKLGAAYAAAIYEGNLYLGTNQGVFYRPWPDQGQPFQLLKGTEGQVWELSVLDGQLLCGHNEGTFLIRNRQAQRISDVTGGWFFSRLNSHTLLQGAYTGIVVFRKDDAGNWRFSHKVNGLTEPIRKLAIGPGGELWAVNQNEGVYRLRLSEDLQGIKLIDTLNTRDGLPVNFLADLLPRPGKTPLIWSKGRYFQWDASSKRCLPAALPATFQPEGASWKLIAGKNGDQFFAFPQQVVWKRKNREPEIFPITLIANAEQIISLNDSLYLFCLDNGFALLNSNRAHQNRRPVTPRIKAVHLLIKGNPQQLQARRWQSDSLLTLPSSANDLQFQFSAPLFTRKPYFRYRLPGFQNDWSEWKTTYLKEFTNLPTGRYTLELQANFSPETARLYLAIAPHWYQTPWAVLGYLLVSFLLLYLLYRVHRHRLELQRRRLSLEKERLLQQQRIQARNEQLQADVLNKSRELANSTFNLIRKNETLLQVKEALEKTKADLGERLPDRYHQKLIQLIDSHLSDEQDWEMFETNFNQVHEVFFKQLKAQFPELTPGDLRLAAYLRMNLSTKEIAPLLNISIRGVENKRYRLRQKLGLDMDDNLTEFLIQM